MSGWYLIGSIPAALIAAWLVARVLWSDLARMRDPDTVDKANLVIAPPIIGFIAFVAWPFLLGLAALAGLAWLFAQAAKPGRFRALLAKRRTKRTRWEFTPLATRCHHETVPVDLVLTGEIVAQLCVKCWERLPPDWSWETDPSWLLMESIR